MIERPYVEHDPGCEGGHVASVSCAEVARWRAAALRNPAYCQYGRNGYHSFGGDGVEARCVYGECTRTLGELEVLAEHPWVEELFRQRDEAIAERDRLRAHILDIDAHATPYGDIPDEPGYVGTYLLTAGALHRALGKVGHSAPSCEAEAERDRLRDQITEADAVIVRAQDALGVDHPVWVILDDYDGSMDSVHALVRERDDARAERDRYAEVVEAARQWRDAIKPCVCGNGDPHQYLVSEGETALVAAVDRLTPPGVSER